MERGRFFIDQRDFPDMPYQTCTGKDWDPKDELPDGNGHNIRASACGICSSVMVVHDLSGEQVLRDFAAENKDLRGLGTPWDAEAPRDEERLTSTPGVSEADLRKIIRSFVVFSYGCKGNWDSGTDMDLLGPALAARFGYTMTPAETEQEVVACLSEGGAVIGYIGGNYDGHVGVFSTGGHYIYIYGYDPSWKASPEMNAKAAADAADRAVVTAGSAAGGDGSAAGVSPVEPPAGGYVLGGFRILDPNLFVGKFDIPGRAGQVEVDGVTCICSAKTLHEDTHNREPHYYLFRKK